MVEEVKAWRTTDGQVHISAQRAAEHELKLTIKKIIPGNEALVNEIMMKRMPIYDALFNYIMTTAPKAVAADREATDANA